MPKKAELSIIIVSYNSRKELPVCLDSLYRFNGPKFKSGQWELLVVDNNSTDDTIQWLSTQSASYPELKVVANKENLGFGAANNLGTAKTSGDYVLFLNPDTAIEVDSINLPLQYAIDHPGTGAVTAKTVLGNGEIDATCHRGFPTPWNAFCFFSGLTKLFPRSKLFSGYTMGYLNLNLPHEVDAINGAFFLMPRPLGKKLGWFDKDFFWKGEDLDLCYRISAAGYKIMYLPQVIVHHYKGASGGHKPGSKTLAARFEVMRLFYKKHYRDKYPAPVYYLVLLGIKILELLANLRP